jgi:Ran GTPase-activating protein (RanGAP) involved in mRNA processing and transport
MEAMTVLDVSKNQLWAQGLKHLAEALAHNQTLTELDISENSATENDTCLGDMSGINALANAIPDMEALSIANVMGNSTTTNSIGKEQLAKLQEIMRSKPNLVSLCGIADDATEADLSGLGMGADDAIFLASELHGKGAMTSLHAGKNNIPEKEMRKIMDSAMYMDSMKILCKVPFKDKTLTALDISGKNLGTEGALVVAEYLCGNRAMTKFDISSNDIQAEGGKALAEGLKGNQVITELNISSNRLGQNMQLCTDTSGIIALAGVIPDIIALTKFDISKNNIGPEGGKVLAAGLKGNQVIIELNIADMSLIIVDDMSGIIALADAIPGMEALSSLTYASNHLGGYNYSSSKSDPSGALKTCTPAPFLLPHNLHVKI